MVYDMDYLIRYQEAEEKLTRRDYAGCIALCGNIAENALKDIYRLQVRWEKKHGREFDPLTSFRESHISHADYEPVKSGLFLLLKFYAFGEIWRAVQARVESNLHFTKKIPWRELRISRNEAVHTFKVFTREQAVEFLHHLKLLLYECELADTRPGILLRKQEECPNCSFEVSASWKFCPDCGSELKPECVNCYRPLEPSWITCPYCDTARSGKLLDINTHELYKAYCEAVWADGIMHFDERDLLARKRIELGISEDEADQIEMKVVPQELLRFSDMIEAVLIDGVITEIEREWLYNNATRLSIDLSKAKEMISHLEKGHRGQRIVISGVG